jgi:hypothetical protein
MKITKAMVKASISLEKSVEEVARLWNSDSPHFGGDMPHRYGYNGSGKKCAYCLRPMNFKSKKK